MHVSVCLYFTSYVYSRVGAVHMDPHLLNASNNFFLVSSQVHAYSSQIPEKQHTENRALYLSILLTNKAMHEKVVKNKPAFWITYIYKFIFNECDNQSFL